MTPPPAPSTRRRLLLWLALSAAALALALALDRVTYRAVHAPDAKHDDWNRLLRATGSLWAWAIAAAAIAFTERVRAALNDVIARALAVFLSAAATGALAELLKLIVRRERPEPHDGAYAFRALAEDTLSTSGLGMPSSHTAVAFGGAFALARLYPAAAPVWIAVAIGCALTRLLDRAHFLSDVVVGAAIAWPVALLITRALNADRTTAEPAP